MQYKYKRKTNHRRRRQFIKKLPKIRSKYNSKDYVFYSILNTEINVKLGDALAMVILSFLTLHNELDADDVTHPHIETWADRGEKIMILRGYNHKHLQYLAEEIRLATVGIHKLYQRWSRSKIVVLTVFGRRENLEDIFEELTPL